MAQTPTAATRAEINSASLNHAYKGQWDLRQFADVALSSVQI
jgi:hypothetical protein